MDGSIEQIPPLYIVVEGPIGVGKTTLVKMLSEKLNARSVLEVFEENPFLPDFYRDRDRYAFQTEMTFLLSRYRQQEHFAQEDLFNRHTVSDYLFYKSRLFATITLQDKELDLFDHVYQILAKDVPTPDAVIYLHAPLDALLARIESRGRNYERGFDQDYLTEVCQLYASFFARFVDTPLFSIDTSNLDLREPEKVSHLLETIIECNRTKVAPGEIKLTMEDIGL